MPTKSVRPEKERPEKERIDKLLVELGLVSTRARAQAMILAGHVLVNDTPVTKAGELVKKDASIRLREPELKYVSRGALKLKAALEAFKIDVRGWQAIDVGASTGGFTEILLENGAAQVFAIDVGTNQLAWKIRNDPRVVARENVNARFLKKDFFLTEEKYIGEFKIAVMDVSFISIKLILPALVEVLAPNADLVILFKPQFEVGKDEVGAGGIVQDQEVSLRVLTETLEWIKTIHLECLGQMDSPIFGSDGNKEYLIHLRKTA